MILDLGTAGGQAPRRPRHRLSAVGESLKRGLLMILLGNNMMGNMLGDMLAAVTAMCGRRAEGTVRIGPDAGRPEHPP